MMSVCLFVCLFVFSHSFALPPLFALSHFSISDVVCLFSLTGLLSSPVCSLSLYPSPHPAPPQHDHDHLTQRQILRRCDCPIKFSY